MSVEDNSGLRVLAINILGRFLSNRDNNIRFSLPLFSFLDKIIKFAWVPWQWLQECNVEALLSSQLNPSETWCFFALLLLLPDFVYLSFVISKAMLLLPHTKFSLGCGNISHFWLDPWIGRLPLFPVSLVSSIFLSSNPIPFLAFIFDFRLGLPFP